MEDKKYYWLKLQKDFFKRHDVKIIEKMANGKDYIIFYLKLLTESISHDGRLRFSDTIPYNEEMLATITDTNVDVVRSAIKIFQSLHLMEVWDEGTFYMTETQKMLGVETEWAKKKREYKARKELAVLAKELPNKYPYKLGNIDVLSGELIGYENGITRYVDEKRYGGNGKLALARSKGFCEHCKIEASLDDTLVIHHMNEYSNELNDLKVLCKGCHGLYHTRTFSSSVPNNFRQEIEKEIELDIDKDNKKNSRFTPPTLEEVKQYINENSYKVDAQNFLDFYTSKGWMVGSNKMKDWKAAVRTWNNKNKEVKQEIPKTTVKNPNRV